MMRASFLTKIFDLLSPRCCAGCHKRLTIDEQFLCSTCYSHLPLTHLWEQADDNPMVRIFWGRINVERAAALFYYEPNTEVAQFIHAIKYGGNSEGAELLGRMAAQQMAATGFFDGIDALVPVPLTKEREHQRGYNQSELIARGISQATGLPVYSGLLRRESFAESQTHLNAYERRENVERAFRLLHSETAAHHHLLLVDDVMTTGSTLMACALQLQQAPGVRLSMLTLGLANS